MFNIFRKKKASSESDFARILAELDDAIRTEELVLSELEFSSQTMISQFTYYATAIMMAYCAGWYLYLRKEEDILLAVLYALPNILIPISILLTRKIIKRFYISKKNRQAAKLETLRKKHKMKLEEMAEVTKFNEIKAIYEKYTSPPVQRTVVTSAPGTLRSPNFNSQGGGPGPAPMARPAEFQSSSQFVSQRSFMEKMLDTIVGDPEGPQSKYALICSNCYTHNGLALPQDYITMKYKCMNCGVLNARDQEGVQPEETTTSLSPNPDLSADPDESIDTQATEASGSTPEEQ